MTVEREGGEDNHETRGALISDENDDTPHREEENLRINPKLGLPPQLLNCGSSSNATFFNHFFIGDFNSGSGFLSTGRSISVTNNKIPPPNSPSPYHTARVLTTASSYSLSIRKIGTHLEFVTEDNRAKPTSLCKASGTTIEKRRRQISFVSNFTEMGRPILCFPDLQPFGPPLQEEPTTATPNHPASDRKRAIQTSRRELFTSESNIKAKR
ncbi:uncharacterized protein LOC112199704 [Rosa chinensis]|uniref:uncharacterized protein LOC112199704 n=1 Tax=Rosa chinensis TaxID=74649 RepID=UPI000D095850|nr:uncharacterized protein LOC112199704 [Rosa chinensis]